MSGNNFIKIVKEKDGKYRGYMGFVSQDKFIKGPPFFKTSSPKEAEQLANEYGWHWSSLVTFSKKELRKHGGAIN